MLQLVSASPYYAALEEGRRTFPTQNFVIDLHQRLAEASQPHSTIDAERFDRSPVIGQSETKSYFRSPKVRFSISSFGDKENNPRWRAGTPLTDDIKTIAYRLRDLTALLLTYKRKPYITTDSMTALGVVAAQYANFTPIVKLKPKKLKDVTNPPVGLEDPLRIALVFVDYEPGRAQGGQLVKMDFRSMSLTNPHVWPKAYPQLSQVIATLKRHKVAPMFHCSSKSLCQLYARTFRTSENLGLRVIAAQGSAKEDIAKDILFRACSSIDYMDAGVEPPKTPAPDAGNTRTKSRAATGEEKEKNKEWGYGRMIGIILGSVGGGLMLVLLVCLACRRKYYIRPNVTYD